ncbi:MAG: hypothetical protein CL916_03615 [Deltaproteobacteria bacterium]|nr:hypothetical protein [Deltaproteobacteria bacterium]
MLWIMFACVSTENKVETKELNKMMSLSFPAFFLSQSLVPQEQNDCFLPIGEDAQHWFPSPDQIASLQKNDLIVQMGAGYEAWVMTASLPSKKLVGLDRDFSKIPLVGQTHSHGSGGEHQHQGTNPFTWLDPNIYRQQLSTLKNQVLSFPLKDTQIVEQRFSTLDAELSVLAESLLGQKEKFHDIKIAANSQSFAYLARALEIDIHPFDFPNEEEFLIKHLQYFMEWYVPGQKTIMIWSYAPSSLLIGKFPPEVQHLYIDTLVQPSQNGSYQYIEQFSQNIQRISEL